jgi:hypothetical protein
VHIKPRRSFLNRAGSTFRRRLVRLSEKRAVTVEIAEDAALFVEQEEVRRLARQGADDRPYPVSGQDGHGEDAVIVQLSNFFETASLYLGT